MELAAFIATHATLEGMAGGRLANQALGSEPGRSAAEGVQEVVVEGDEVVVGASSTELMSASLLALVGPSHAVLVPDTPAAPLYTSLVRLAGASPVRVPAAMQYDPLSGQPIYQEPDAWVESIRERVVENTRALVLASPCEVTGALLPHAHLAAAAALCRSLVCASTPIPSPKP